MDGFKNPTGKSQGFVKLTRHISIKHDDIIFFNQCPDICHIFLWNFFDTSLRKTGASWKNNVHSQLVHPLFYMFDVCRFLFLYELSIFLAIAGVLWVWTAYMFEGVFWVWTVYMFDVCRCVFGMNCIYCKIINFRGTFNFVYFVGKQNPRN